MKKIILSSALWPLFVAYPAMAQTASTEVDEGANSSDQAGVGEIVVTAQRRSENLQKTALAVNVIGGNDLIRSGVSQAQDLSRLIPALKLSNGGGGGTQVTIRGIGSFNGLPFAEPGVATNLDGVYLARSGSSNGLFYDLERVEVLKGPQGTLYGRNATAGAVNIITRKPSRDFELQAGMEVGNYGKMRGDLAVNVPIEGLGALRVAGVVSRQEGFLESGYQDDDTNAVRAQISFDRGGPFTALLSADYSHLGGKGSGGVFALSETDFVSPDPRLGPSRDGSNAILQNVSSLITGGLNPNLLPPFKEDGFVDITNWGLAATLNYDFGGIMLTALPAYRRNEAHYLHYNGGFPTSSDEYSKATSVEVRLASTDNNASLQWMLGGYYFNEDLNLGLTAFQGAAYGETRPALKTQSLAAFGQVTYALSAAFRLTGGLRYTNEKKSMSGERGFQDPPLGVGFPVTYIPLIGRIDDDSVTWKAGLEIDAGSASLLYANVATGFKAGGFFSSQPPNTTKPERLTAYTIGAKNRLFDNKLQVNLEGFYWKYSDKQVSHIGPVRPVGFDLITENAGSAEVYGVEVDLVWQPTINDRFAANIQHTQSKYLEFTYSQTTLTGPPQTTCAISPLSATSVTVDCAGRPLPRAPKWTLNLSYLHTFEIGEAKLDALIGTRIESRSVLGEEYLDGQYQQGYMMSNASLTWRGPEDRYSVAVYIDNIENETLKATSFVQPIVGLPVVTLEAPRTYGIRARFNF
ncbi:TonB-dependent receptor [Sphingobium yanoikuyae]|uniref:TonB-dependent receptor n=1 Tax=Sphingobium yanoikuyae TaxID=13690 RepID=A0A6P1GLX8_SPHYA|nr:TonB-dependent receptor [Sphingobium yanoikuyae]QHD69577.1 TonB-dependent receptor [Sphingobium yanoikuyae]